MPLNASGKLDRRALQATQAFTFISDDIAPPENETEKFICDAFMAVLDVSAVGRSSNFFSLGGTSLSVISLLSKDGFENISAADFIKNPTPESLARIMTKAQPDPTEFLEPLHTPFYPTKSLILLPYAGGGAEAFSEFVKAFADADEDTAIYFIRYLHTSDECEAAAQEIAQVLGNTELYIYSHCVGSAVAIRLLNSLEQQGTSVKHFFAGASIPPEKPTDKNLWNIVPNPVLKRILTNAGASFDGLPYKKIKEILSVFRKDTDFANVSFASLARRFNTPVSVIISKKDYFTQNYADAEKLWNNYARTVSGVHFIDSQSHYFQSENSKELVKIISEIKK